MENCYIVYLFQCLGFVGIKTNHSSITVNIDEPYELVCNAVNMDIRACMFMTPSGDKHMIWDGVS